MKAVEATNGSVCETK